MLEVLQTMQRRPCQTSRWTGSSRRPRRRTQCSRSTRLQLNPLDVPVVTNVFCWRRTPFAPTLLTPDTSSSSASSSKERIKHETTNNWGRVPIKERQNSTNAALQNTGLLNEPGITYGPCGSALGSTRLVCLGTHFKLLRTMTVSI